MKSIKIILLIGMLALLPLLADGGEAQTPEPAKANSSSATVKAAISYQGLLTDPTTGEPLSGDYDLEFTFWPASSEGVQVGSTVTRNGESITNGLYSTSIDVDTDAVYGQELWLQIRVRETGATSWETLDPRIEVLPTAYALSLRPGAQIEGGEDAPDAVVMATNASSGWGLRGESTDPTGYGVYGYNGSTSSSAYGGGVIGIAETDGYGVRGEAPSSGDFCYGGYFVGRTGIRSYGTGDNSLYDYGGYFLAQRRGIYAASASGYYAAYFNGAIYVNGTIYPRTAQQTVAVNGSDETLEPGDVVAIAGIAEFPGSTEPILVVRKANDAVDIAVVGVVAQAMLVQEVDLPDGEPWEKLVDVQPVEGDIPPAGYLAIVSQGLMPAVKVSALPAAMAVDELRVGELLSLGAVPGTVQKAEAQLVDGRSAYEQGTILGKVAGPFDPQTGTVPVFVTLQ